MRRQAGGATSEGPIRVDEAERRIPSGPPTERTRVPNGRNVVGLTSHRAANPITSHFGVFCSCRGS